ncbi:MAG: MerR family transcriptional regulator [Gammaproteobacteria bacterium]
MKRSRRATARMDFDTAQAARLTGLAPRQIRAWAAGGLIRPARVQGGKACWSFNDLVGLRVLAVLHADFAIGTRKLRRLLPALRDAVGACSTLEALAASQLAVTGDTVVLVETSRAYDRFVDLLRTPGQSVLAIMPMDQVIWDLQRRAGAAPEGATRPGGDAEDAA